MWKDVKEYEGVYQVSDDGQVRRILTDGRTKPVKNREGLYLTVSLSHHGIKKSKSVHRMVAEAFLDRPANATEVNHKDGNKHNNDVSNLEWITPRQNQIHADISLGRPLFGKPAKKVKCLDPVTNELIAEFSSISEAARSFGKISARQAISNVCQGYANTAYGYRWEYTE